MTQPSTLTPDPAASDWRSYSLQDWRGGHESLKQEHAYWIDDIEGEIPSDLQGTLFRNGPGLLDINGTRLHHPFDGDGMVCAITFQDGRAHFRNRFVRTAGFLAEQKAGKILYRGVFGTQKPGGWLANAFDFQTKNIANTNVIYWGGKLLALWEAAQPYRLNPVNLETMGLDDLNGLLDPSGSFAAHPLIDPGDGEQPPRLVNFAIQPGLSTRLKIYELGVGGEVLANTTHTLPGFAFIHDFALTPHYYIFFQNPVLLNPIPYALGLRSAGQCLTFQAQQPTRIWVIPRQGTAPMQCLLTDACFVFHHANAYEAADQTLIVDSICYDRFPQLEADTDYRSVDFASLPAGQLWRFTLDLAQQTVQQQVLTTRCCEFPARHPQQVGRPYRYLFIGAAHAAEGNAPLQDVLKLDLESGEQTLWSAAPHGFMGEPVFVPKGSASRGPDDAGWLLCLVYDATHHRSDVVILDGENLSRGAIARLHLKHHVPYGLHGSFVPLIFNP